MSGTSSSFGFELVRRGYDRGQVDEHIAKLVAERDSALDRITALEKRVEELHLEYQSAYASLSGPTPPQTMADGRDGPAGPTAPGRPGMMEAPAKRGKDEAQHVFGGRMEDSAACLFCAGFHTRVAGLDPTWQPCPRVRRIERHGDGTVQAVEYWPPSG